MTHAIYLERGDLVLKQYTADKIRNIALAGHGSDGKTSLTEAMLYLAGATDRLGSIADGNTVCDFDPEEARRQISVSSSIAPLEHKGVKVNVIDTPGLFDFAGGFYEGVRAADTVVITLSAKSGALVGTEKAWRLAGAGKKARAFFISKLDQENADYFKALESLKQSFGDSVCPVVVPINGTYVNLIEKKAYTFNKGKAVEAAMPADDRLEELSMSIAEEIANTSDDLMEKFFADEPFTAEEMAEGLRKGLHDGTIAPVFCGDAITLGGVSLLLDAVAGYFPSAEAAASETAEDAGGNPVEIKCSADEPLAALVFKTVADPFVGKLSFVKVISGAVTSALIPVNARTGQPERLGKMVFVRGKQQDTTDSVTAGDIGALTKLAEARTGDTLCDPRRVVSLKKSEFPAPTMRMAIFSKSKGDESKVASSISRIMEEDATVSYEIDTETKQQILSGLGEQHLDVVVSKLKNKFGVDLGLEVPHVAYRETIRKKVKVQGKHKKQSGGHGQYGDVWVEFEPTDGEEMVFEEAVFGGSVPRNFFPAVEKGLREACKVGMLAGYPMVGVLARLVDGSYHPVDSNDMSFQMAARLAYKAGIPQAVPILLEPVGELKVLVPSANAGDIMGDLNKRRGRVLGMNPCEDNTTEVVAEVPMSETADLTTALRSMTQGRGSFSLHFIRYDELPKMLEAGVIEAAKQWMASEED